MPILASTDCGLISSARSKYCRASFRINFSCLVTPWLSCSLLFCSEPTYVTIGGGPPSISNLSTARRHCRRRLSRLGWVRSIASVQHPYQSALHNAPLAASPAASTTEMVGLANIVTPGTKLNTVCSPSKPTRAAGQELQNPCRTSSGPVAFGRLLAMCCWSSLITSAGITVVDCAVAVLRLYGIASASCHPPVSGRMPT